MELDEMTMDIELHVDVNGPIEAVYQSVLQQVGAANVRPDGESLNMKLEEWAGGRWYRDRGQGIQHLWGHVQVIKPPSLLELSGPLLMSYPAINHIEVKLAETGGKGTTRVSFRHRAIGMLDPGLKEGVQVGWQHLLDAVKGDFAKTEGSQT
ncbi:MAG: SRPBCC domain-containing protein [Pyrinomonadaceae bacterium]